MQGDQEFRNRLDKEVKARFKKDEYVGKLLRVGPYVLEVSKGDSEPKEVSFERGPTIRVKVLDTNGRTPRKAAGKVSTARTNGVETEA